MATLCLSVLLSACGTQPVPEDQGHHIRLFSENYLPPVFMNDQRTERIKEIVPIIQTMIEKYAAAHNIPGMAYGIVVDKDLVLASATGQINLEKELPATINSSFRIASMTKSFTAMAILKLRDEGKLTLRDPVEDYVPGFSNLNDLTEDAPVIDIENLLTMTAGFPEDNPWGDRQLDETDQMLIDYDDNYGARFFWKNN